MFDLRRSPVAHPAAPLVAPSAPGSSGTRWSSRGAWNSRASACGARLGFWRTRPRALTRGALLEKQSAYDDPRYEAAESRDEQSDKPATALAIGARRLVVAPLGLFRQ